MSSEPPVLSYDKPNTLSTRRSHWIIPGYSVGVLAMGVVYSLIAYLFLTRHYSDSFERLLYGILLPISLPFATLLPQIIFLGLTLWLKRKIAKEVRFGGFRAAFIWGAVEGLFPYSLVSCLPEQCWPCRRLHGVRPAWLAGRFSNRSGVVSLPALACARLIALKWPSIWNGYFFRCV
jgi:hypothetical protein